MACLARRWGKSALRWCSTQPPQPPQQPDDERFEEEGWTREEVRRIINHTWEEKLRMGEEEVSKAQANDDPIFQAHALTGYCPTSIGPMPVPFQFTDSSACVIGGFADADAVEDMTSGEDVDIVRCSDGSVPMLIWMWQHSDTTTTVGQHSNSMQFFTFATRKDPEGLLKLDTPPPPHPLIQHALFTDTQYPSVRCLPLGMWEESDQALAYNREVLGYPSLPTVAHYNNDCTLLKDLYNEHRRIKGFSFIDTLTGHTILKGEAHFWEGGLRSPTTYAKLAALLGPKEMALRRMRRWQKVPLMCPRSSYVTHHADSDILFQTNLEQLRMWNKGRPWLFEDKLMLGRTRWAKLRFSPRWVNHMGGCKGIITPPYNHNGDVNHARIGWESEEPTFPHLPLAKMSPSIRHGRIPDGSPILTKGVGHLPSPGELQQQWLRLSLERKGLSPDGSRREEVKHVE